MANIQTANGKHKALPCQTQTARVLSSVRPMKRQVLKDTAYVECHGTGTPVGDLTEVEAVSRVFNRSSKNPFLVGSVKTNLGHSGAASGISSVIKATLALEKSYIPATIGIGSINPKINARNGVLISLLSREHGQQRSLSNLLQSFAGLMSILSAMVVLMLMPSSTMLRHTFHPTMEELEELPRY